MNIVKVSMDFAKRVPLVQWGPYVGESFTERKRQEFGVEMVKEVLESLKDKDLGIFLGVKNVIIEKIEGLFEDLKSDHLVLTAKVEAYYYQVSNKEIIPITVEKVTPKVLVGSSYGERVEIPLEALSSMSGSYNSSLEAYQIGDLKICAGDLLLGKVSGVSVEKEENCYLLKASCKNQGAGKVTY